MAILLQLPLRDCSPFKCNTTRQKKAPLDEAEDKKVQLIPIDLIETETDYKIFAELPGFNRNQVNIEFDQSDNLIHIIAQRDETDKTNNKETDQAKSRWIQRECFSLNKLERYIEIPKDISINDISESMKDGVWEILIPRSKNKDVKKFIQIN